MNLKNVNGWSVVISFVSGLGAAAAKELLPQNPWLVPLFLGLTLSFLVLAVFRPLSWIVRFVILAGGVGLVFVAPSIFAWASTVLTASVPVWQTISVILGLLIVAGVGIWVLLRPRELGQGDRLLLEEFAKTFSGNKMHFFITTLEDTACVFTDQMQDFEDAVRLYRSGHKRFRHPGLEKAKNRFLDALHEFELFTHEHFNSIDSRRAKFYGGVGEYDLMTKFASSYPTDEKRYIELARQVNDTWEAFIRTTKNLDHDYQWPN